MADDNSDIPTPKRGAFPVPKGVLEKAKRYTPDKDKPEDNSSRSSSDSSSKSQEKPDERNEEESPPPK